MENQPQLLKDVLASPFQSKMWIDGEERNASDGQKFERIYPAGSGIVSITPAGTIEDAKDAIAAAERSFLEADWSESYGGDKAKVLYKVAQMIRRDQEELALIETVETGKPLHASMGEVEASAELWEYAAGLARTVHGDALTNLGPDMMGVITRQPIGVVSIITPWNFPLLIACERIPFALAAGCSVVVKASELTASTTLRLGKYLKDAGLPDGVCNIVSGAGRVIGPALIEDPRVKMVSFTGSPAVGETVIHASAKTKKKLSLELGGKSPSVVFDDCDVEAAIDGVLKASNFNAGQCCIAGSRLIVQETIADEFLSRLIERSKEIVVGDPFSPTTTLGAIVSKTQFEQIDQFVKIAEADGAKILTQGVRQSNDGLFYGPTIVDGVSPKSAIAQEEIFGPVLTTFRFSTVQEAIKLANSTNYGLAAYIWTQDLNKALSSARRIEAGRIWINSALHGFPEMPLGGFDQSGVGRETGSIGIDEYCEPKSIHIHHNRQNERWVSDT